MWSANVTAFDRTQDKTTIVVTVEYTDGATIEVKTYKVLTDTDLKSIIVAQVAAFDAADKLERDSPIGAVDLSPPEGPSDEDKARAAFFDDWRTYQGMQRAVAAGLLAADAKEVADLNDRLKSAFLIDYVSRL